MDFRGQQPGFDGYQPPQHMVPHVMMNNAPPGYAPGPEGGLMNSMGMPPNTSVMPNSMGGGLMPAAGSPMMAGGRAMMPNSSGDTVSVTDPFADSTQGNGQFPRPNYTSGGTMQANMQNAGAGFPVGYNRSSGPYLPGGPSQVSGTPGSGNAGGSGSGSGGSGGGGSGGPGSGAGPGGGGPGGSGSSPSQFSGAGGDAMNRSQGPPQSEHYPNDPYRRGMAPGPDGYPRGSMQQGQQGFPSQFSGNRSQTAGNQSSGSQYNQYGDNRCGLISELLQYQYDIIYTRPYHCLMACSCIVNLGVSKIEMLLRFWMLPNQSNWCGV